LPPQLFVRNSTFAGNTATNDGGAIYSYDGTFSLFQSTISGNSAGPSGGGLYLATTASYVGTGNETFSTIERSTVTLNSGGDGGGIATNYYQGSQLRNSIVSGNSSAFGMADLQPNGNTSITFSYNLIGGNAMLGPLMFKGGRTRTHLPMAASPVINAADPMATGDADQRGFEPRIVGGRMDMGSVEVGAVAVCDFDSDGDCDLGDIDRLTMAIAAGGGNPTLDLNDDGQVNLTDRDIWLSLAGVENLPCRRPYLLGDMNLDGDVNNLDFDIWNINKFAINDRWSRGDLNADGVTDGSDFSIWNQHRSSSSCSSIARDTGGTAGWAHDGLLSQFRAAAANANRKMESVEDAARSRREWLLDVESPAPSRPIVLPAPNEKRGHELESETLCVFTGENCVHDGPALQPAAGSPVLPTIRPDFFKVGVNWGSARVGRSREPVDAITQIQAKDVLFAATEWDR
jgi:predicted outer membrane repeat protein